MKKILSICRSELEHILKDQGVALFVFLVPLFYPLLYAFIYTNETVREVPVAVVDRAGSPMSRQFTRMLDAAPEVNLVASCLSVAEAEQLNKRGEIYAFVVIPEDFDKTLARGNQSIIGVYADMAGMFYYKSALLAATNVSLEMNKQIKVERFYTGATDRQEEIATQPIAYDYVEMFNPQGGFASFLMPAVMMLILQQTLMLGLGMINGGIRERYGVPVPPGLRGVNALEIVIGKTAVFFVIYIVMSLYMFTVVTDLFGLPSLGNIWTYLALMVPYILACCFMGITFSAFVFRREDCILLFVFMSVPLLFISGISWPGSAIPPFWKWVSYLFPSTFAVNGYVRINSMGATLSQVSTEFYALWGLTLFYLLTAIIFYRRSLKGHEV
ncbi:MAG: ABC transporter permease [Bacteroides sp.]|nr:ABC transporter permease [Bacteroides sp.]MCM1379243.1 ABC transporter permease [Bacteroides sp.]MCM1445099.1 ABC transporter permease [Prevotella sp.]